ARIAVPGTHLRAGATVAAVAPASGPPRALLLVPPEQAAALAPGQPARVAVPGGLATGRVSEVGAFPVTAHDLRHRFGVGPVAGGPGHLVTVELARASDRAGPTPAQAEITGAVPRPIEVRLPGDGHA